MQRIASAAVGFGLTGSDVLVILVAALPPFLVLAIPIAYMMSILIGMGRISQDLELVALKSAGMGPFRLARGPIALGALISALCVPLAVHGEPYGLNLLYERLVDVGLRNITSAIRPGVFNTGFRRIALYAASRDKNGDLVDVLVSDERNAKQPIMLTAARGRLVPRSAKDLTLNLEDGEIHMGLGTSQQKYDLVRFDEASLGIDAAQELKERTRFVSELGRLSSSEMQERVTQLGPDNKLGRRIEKTYWRRFAFPSMALVFGIFALAIILSGGPSARARNALWALGAVVTYYILTRVGDYAVVQYPGTPFWAAFGPNFVILFLGLWGLMRSGRAR